MHSALPARLLVDDTHAYMFMDCEGGNRVSAPGVGGNMPLVAVKCNPHLEVAVCDLVMSGDLS